MTDNKFMREARAELGLSQPKLAAKLDISRPTIARYEREGYNVPESIIQDVERFLRIHRRTKS